MRILFDSKLPQFKTPFGCLTPGQDCTLTIHIPASVQTTAVTCVMTFEHGEIAQLIPMGYKMKKGPYDHFQGTFSLPDTGLYFYFFRIETRSGCFKLFKEGDDTNMEAGRLFAALACPECNE